LYEPAAYQGNRVTEETNAVELAAELTAAWLANPNTRTSADDVPAFLLSMHAAVSKLAAGPAEEPEAAAEPVYEGKVTARKSLASPDHIISMLDGKPYKTLRRHLASNGLTPEEYRSRFNLKADYPMVAPSYSAARSSMAKTIGLGRKPVAKVEKPAKAGRASKAAKPASDNDA
jgi:predicted transcriptional regulator